MFVDADHVQDGLDLTCVRYLVPEHAVIIVNHVGHPAVVFGVHRGECSVEFDVHGDLGEECLLDLHLSSEQDVQLVSLVALLDEVDAFFGCLEADALHGGQVILFTLQAALLLVLEELVLPHELAESDELVLGPLLGQLVENSKYVCLVRDFVLIILLADEHVEVAGGVLICESDRCIFIVLRSGPVRDLGWGRAALLTLGPLTSVIISAGTFVDTRAPSRRWPLGLLHDRTNVLKHLLELAIKNA